MDCSLPGSSVHGIFQAGILEWVAVPFSRGSSGPRDWSAGRLYVNTKPCYKELEHLKILVSMVERESWSQSSMNTEGWIYQRRSAPLEKGTCESKTWTERILRKRKSQDNSWRISSGKRKNMLDRLARSVRQEGMTFLIETLPVSIFFFTT